MGWYPNKGACSRMVQACNCISVVITTTVVSLFVVFRNKIYKNLEELNYNLNVMRLLFDQHNHSWESSQLGYNIEKIEYYKLYKSINQASPYWLHHRLPTQVL